MSLRGPNGRTVRLVDFGDFGLTVEGNNRLRFQLAFDDDGAQFPLGYPIAGRVYHPRENLAAFDGDDPAASDGGWTLSVADERSPGPVCVFGFSVSIVALPPAP